LTEKANAAAQPTIIFVHIPKTAGTTLARIIDRQYPPQARLLLERHHESVREFQALSEERRSEIRLLRGHIPYGLHVHCPRPTTYIVLLREPLDRLISYYYYVQREAQHYLYDYANTPGMTLKRYVEDRVSLQMDNMQTRLISGVWSDPGYGECDQATLDLAKQNLEEHFAVVGLTERFDETLLLLKRALGWHNVHYARHNVTRDRPRRASLDAETVAVLEAHNQLDIELYQHAQGLFGAQLDAQGPSFARELRAFQIVNRLVQPVARTYWQVRQFSVRAWLKQKLNRSPTAL
jgi:hypothetical protein